MTTPNSSLNYQYNMDYLTWLKCYQSYMLLLVEFTLDKSQHKS